MILEFGETVKYAQWQETIKTREGLETSLTNAAQRYIYYERILDRSENDIAHPEFEALNVLSQWRSSNLPPSEPEVIRRSIEVDIAQDLGASGGKVLSTHEARDIESTRSARDCRFY